MVVKTSGSIYKDFLSCKTSNPEEKRSREGTRGAHEPPGRAWGVARPGALWAPGWPPMLFVIFVFFLKFQN